MSKDQTLGVDMDSQMYSSGCLGSDNRKLDTKKGKVAAQINRCLARAGMEEAALGDLRGLLRCIKKRKMRYRISDDVG